MPISTNPNATARYWLPCDADLPEDQRPMFLVRFMSQDDLDRHAALMQEAKNEADDLACALKLMAAVKVGIKGWKNFKAADGSELPFTDQNFFDQLIDHERWVVAWSYPNAVRLTKIDFGFFASRAPSAGALDASTPPAAP